MSSAPVVDRIRIIPRPNDFLDRNVGASGEVFFNRATSSLRVYTNKNRGNFGNKYGPTIWNKFTNKYWSTTK